MYFKYSVIAASMVAALSLAGCGSDSSSDTSTGSGNDSGNDSIALTQGAFIDAKVEGLYYVSKPSGKEGFTDAEGTYEFTEGDTVTFYLGGIDGLLIGSASAQAITTPFTVTGTAKKAMNLARILQSMDDPSNGAITLPDSIKYPSGEMKDALNEIQLNQLSTADTLKTELQVTDWVSEEAAQKHLNESLSGLVQGSQDVLVDWQKGSGKYLRELSTTLTAQGSTNSVEVLSVHVDQLLPHPTRGTTHTTVRLDEQNLVLLKGSNDTVLSGGFAALYLTCINEDVDNSFVLPSDSAPAQCNGKDLVNADPQFILDNTFTYNILSHNEEVTKDEAETWEEAKAFKGLYKCIADKNCSEATLTGFSINEYDNIDEQDDSNIRKDVISTSYDSVTGVYTEVKNRTVLSGQYKGRISNSVNFAYMVDDADAERYVDFKGTWTLTETRPDCKNTAPSTATSTFTFNEQGVSITGKKFDYATCNISELEENLNATYAELAKMDFWWFTTNGANNTSKATLTQLNNTIRWCDDDKNGENKNDTCQNIKFNRWEYAPAGKNWDRGVLHRSALDSAGNITSNITLQKL